MSAEMRSEGCVECHLKLEVEETFDLEKAVCSYGFFMMAPNLWLSSSSTLQRPLRLSDDTAVMVHISQQKSPASSTLIIRVIGVDTLTIQDQQYLLGQVVRMLRLSEMEESAIRGFHALHPQAKAEGFGRIFRSPNLFEDMVKSILLCNCGWVRTLDMAQSLCVLQSELKGQPRGWSTVQETTSNLKKISAECDYSRRSKKKQLSKHMERKGRSKKPRNLAVNLVADRFSGKEMPLTDIKQNLDVGLCQDDENVQPHKILEANLSHLSSTFESTCDLPSVPSIGDFPTPKELASLDETFLAKRCSLGYRAKRILKLAMDICGGAIDLSSLENSDGSPHLHFTYLKEFFLKLDGFGPFTCAIVLMCMGDYQSIPADTETVRHLKMVHGRSQCTLYTVAEEVEEVYARYAPFQFLAYWCEMWDWYGKSFGKLSQMPPSDYHLITGPNMRKKFQIFHVGMTSFSESAA